jgi:hypothetical protein
VMIPEKSSTGRVLGESPMLSIFLCSPVHSITVLFQALGMEIQRYRNVLCALTD